ASSAVTRCAKCGEASSAKGDPDRLLFRVLVERLEALVAAAEAGLLVAAEGRRDVALGVGVHADGAGSQRPSDPERGVEVPGVHGRREAVGRLVGETDALLLRVAWNRRQHGPEDLLPRDRHVVADAVEDRR